MSQETSGNCFERLVLRNVRCFREAEIELDPKVTVLIGENGSGKTTVMEALASLCYGEEEGLAEFPLTRGARSGEIALFASGREQPAAAWKVPGRARKGRRLSDDRPLFAYGRYRRVYFPDDADFGQPHSSPSSDFSELSKHAGQRRTATLFQPDNHLLRDLSRYLAALYYGRRLNPALKAVWERLDDSLAELGHGIEGLQMVRSRRGYIPRIVRNGLPLELRELSDGYQSTLVIVFDLILRYTYRFPNLENPLEGEATVGIDEVDLHLHPRWQRTVVRQLANLFPNTQFILTTHSAAVVQGAIDFRRRVITLQEKDGAALARTLTRKDMDQLDGAEIGSVLVEEKLFGTRSRYSPKYSEIEDRIARIQRKIRRGRAGDEDRAQLLQDLNTLQSLVVADEERRADGSFMSQMSGLRKALLEDLAAEYQRLKS
jgi:energy-coupling factor transporter ATP-binding protein EcfA2